MTSTTLSARSSTAYLFHMSVQCINEFNEVLPHDKVGTELTIEDMIGRILLEQFESVLVDDVSTRFSSFRETEQQCTLQIYATCLNDAYSPTPYNKEFTE